MDLPHLPTDNLYKFMALSGIVIALFSFGLPIHHLYTINERLESFEVETAVLTVKSTHIREDILDLSHLSNPDSNTLQKLKQANRELQVYGVQLETKTHQAHSLLRFWYLEFGCGILWFLIGCTLAVLGFRAWYERSQRFQDELLKQQARIATKPSIDRDPE